MKIFITGIEGYIGTVLAQELIQAGHQVAGLDAGFYRESTLYEPSTQNIPVLRKDIRDIQAADVEGFDALVHLAELANDPLGELYREGTQDISFRGTQSAIRACKQAGVKRLVYFSSCSVYGFTDHIATEESPVHPLTTYAEMKILNEKLLRSAADRSFSPVILRNATAYGASPRMRFDLAINNLVGWAYTTGHLRLESEGNQWRPFVHILDIANAVQSVLAAPLGITHRQIFNVGAQNANYRIKEVAQIIAGQIPGCQISFQAGNRDKRSYRVGFEKAHEAIPQFSCKKTIQEGIQELFALFQRIGLTKEQFQAHEFQRLGQIQHLQKTNKITKNYYWVKEPILA